MWCLYCMSTFWMLFSPNDLRSHPKPVERELRCLLQSRRPPELYIIRSPQCFRLYFREAKRPEPLGASEARSSPPPPLWMTRWSPQAKWMSGLFVHKVTMFYARGFSKCRDIKENSEAGSRKAGRRIRVQGFCPLVRTDFSVLVGRNLDGPHSGFKGFVNKNKKFPFYYRG